MIHKSLALSQEPALHAISPDCTTSGDGFAKVHVDGRPCGGFDALELARGRDVETLHGKQWSGN